jgi:hypothetical protein
MIKRIRILDAFGPRPATSKQARHFHSLFLDSKVDWLLDFTGVEELTPAFEEEFFLALADRFGPDVFARRLTWVQLASPLQRALHAAIQKRMLGSVR